MHTQTETHKSPSNPPLSKGEQEGLSPLQKGEQRGLFVPVRFFPGEREIFRQKENLTVSQWAEKYRHVSIGAHKGPWRNEISPHLSFIMDTWGQPYVRKIVICAAPQTGKTEVAYNCIAYAADRKPRTTMVVMPTQLDSRKVATDRIIPMFQDSPRLRKLLSDNPDDTASNRIKLKNGARTYMAWANSASALATFPIENYIADEVDKWPLLLKKETSPLYLLEQRTITFPHTWKGIVMSTPTTEKGLIWQELNNADCRYDFFHKCLDCLHEQVMEFSKIKWPEEKTARDVQRENMAHYVCQKCGCLWNNYQKNKAYKIGGWQKIKGEHISRPQFIGFHMPALVSPDVSISEIAASYIDSKQHKPALIQFYNRYLAEPFVESQEGETVQEDLIYNRRYDYAPQGAQWQIPMKACVLTCFVDVQSNRLEAEVVAWAGEYESWGIEYKQFPGDPSEEQVWQSLDTYLQKEWLHESGNKLKIAICGVDSGFKAAEVYRFVRKRQMRRVYACKGSSTRGKALISVNTRTIQKKLKDRLHVNLINIGTETGKDSLFSWMQTEAPGPRYMHYHNGYGYDYFRMLTAEKAIIKYDRAGRPYREWVKKHGDARNEALDIRVGNYAMLELLNPNFKALSAPIAPVAPEESKVIQQRTKNRRVLSRGV